jgi:hypothetical protein
MVSFLLFGLIGGMHWGCAPLNPAVGKGLADTEPGLNEAAPVKTHLSRYLKIKALNADTTVATQPYIAFLPFKNKSDFRKGVWELEKVLPAFFSSHLSTYLEWRVVPHEVVTEVLNGAKKYRRRAGLCSRTNVRG